MNYKQVIQQLTDHIQKTDPKKMWILDNLQYLTLGGSHAYGTETINSDFDYIGITIPPRKYLYPSEKGLIFGYDEFPTFNQFEYQSKNGDKNEHIDITIYNIVQYFKLLKGNNPNIIDSIFTKQNCVLFITDIGKLIVDNREVFLHKGVYTKFKSYAFNMLKKIETKYLKQFIDKCLEYGIPVDTDLNDIELEIQRRKKK